MEPLHSSRNTVAVLALVVGFALGALAVSFNGAGKGLQGTLVPPPGASSSAMSQQVTAMPGKTKKYCSCACKHRLEPNSPIVRDLCVHDRKDRKDTCDTDFDLGQISDEACEAATGSACRGFWMPGEEFKGELVCASVYVGDKELTPSSDINDDM
jgi:hypothetical protein